MKSLFRKVAFSILSLLSLIVVIGFIIFSQSEEFIVLKVKFQSCPYNHYSLKAVPISYGFIMPDSNTIQKYDNYEYFPGGCVVTKDSPRYQVVCTKCGYVLEKSDSTECWLRRDTVGTGFEIKLNKIISKAPIINLFTLYGTSSLIYMQEYKNGKVYTEVISYETTSKIVDLEQELLKYVSSNSLEVNEIDLIKENYYDYYQYIKSYKAIRENKEFELTIPEHYMDYVNSRIKKPKRPNTEFLELWIEDELDIENPGSYGNLPTDESHVTIEPLPNGNYKMKISDIPTASHVLIQALTLWGS